jgi:hypothetical protein
MRCLVSASFEFDRAAPETWRGEIVAASPESVVRNAVKALRRAHPNRQWRSLVVCVLERLDNEPEPKVEEGSPEAEAEADV